MEYSDKDIEQLQLKCKEIRRDILNMIYNVQSGHGGGSLSIVEILVALYHKKLKVNPKIPQWEDRDRFILSKGHCTPAYYAVLADMGYFPHEDLMTSYRVINGRLQGHPDMKKTLGVDMSTGSLGIGLSAGCGMALGAKIKKKDFRVYVLIGDGETNEGQIWEAAKTAAHYKLENLTAIVDVNEYQNDGATKEEMDMSPLGAKWEAFGWKVLEVDGHDLRQILAAFDKAQECRSGPSVIICHTVKCKGVSFMEQDKVKYHGAPLNYEQLQQALSEIG
ncbi:transketolase [Clostridium thermosuccinogenes]|uniref:Transketolase n=1 Tax=Clostridium thermosuccinogenes TaxID=84032 RepID=A0A2K2FKY6_9CLOT|nr:transketolase [Pseudoclostridium thermosuccinogenes]AUS96053.1 transketolase [Pseudoclostridium thermosuccinogenes]PNT99441.1 transketolase [Pseudoclostridium thermosuccinogenes]PNU01128.1 transketolase [Pseudoclostridium thermosuccinogenes]